MAPHRLRVLVSFYLTDYFISEIFRNDIYQTLIQISKQFHRNVPHDALDHRSPNGSTLPKKVIAGAVDKKNLTLLYPEPLDLIQNSFK